MKPYYQDDSATLYHGDCRDVTAWLDADVLITDPPYGIGWTVGAAKAHANGGARAAKGGIQNDADTSVRDQVLSSWAGRPAVVFGSLRAPFPADVKQTLVWRKPIDAGVVGSTTGYRTDTELIFLLGPHARRAPSRSSVLTTDGGVATYRTAHPHSKPLALLQQLMEWVPGVVADPFAGGGSTLVAAKHLGRRAVGVEIEERYCELIAKRLSQGVLEFGEAS